MHHPATLKNTSRPGSDSEMYGTWKCRTEMRMPRETATTGREQNLKLMTKKKKKEEGDGVGTFL